MGLLYIQPTSSVASLYCNRLPIFVEGECLFNCPTTPLPRHHFLLHMHTHYSPNLSSQVQWHNIATKRLDNSSLCCIFFPDDDDDAKNENITSLIERQPSDDPVGGSYKGKLLEKHVIFITTALLHLTDTNSNLYGINLANHLVVPMVCVSSFVSNKDGISADHESS